MLLDRAMCDEDIPGLLDLKDQGHVIHELTVQKDLGKGLVLSAAEFVRRVERALGWPSALARSGGRSGGGVGYGTPGSGLGADDTESSRVSPKAIIPNSYEREDAYAFADDVTDDEFEGALAAGKAEENLSRANVRRKLKPECPEHLRKTRHIDPNRVVDSTAGHGQPGRRRSERATA